MKNSKILLQSKAISILTIIFIGALGSGLWDVFLKDIAFYLGDSFVRFLSYVFSGYLDHLYENVGKATNILVHIPSILIIILIILSPIIFYLILARQFDKTDSLTDCDKPNSNTDSRRFPAYITNNRGKALMLLLFPGIMLSFLYAELLVAETSHIAAVSYIERSLEIIRPYIDEKEYYTLWSEYRLIDDKDKLEALLKKAHDIAGNNEVNLPEVKLFGIDVPSKAIQSTLLPRATDS